MSPRHLITHVLAVAATFATVSAAANPKQEFTRRWEGQTVVLRHALYTLSYTERGLLGTTHHKRDGVSVVTPFNGMYYQFDGRQSRDDVLNQDPERLMDAVRTAYQGDSLDIRAYSKVEPITLTRYTAGVELVVSAVRIERDRARLFFEGPRGSERMPATALTIQWPVPFSRDFTERDAVDDLIRRFVQLREGS
jgi:hypothetical protein